MATTDEYMEYVCGQLELVENFACRKMFGEYALYSCGKVFGGIYDNRLMIKITEAGKSLLGDCQCELPYEGAKPMFLPDCIEDKEFLAEIVRQTCKDLPLPRQKTKK